MSSLDSNVEKPAADRAADGGGGDWQAAVVRDQVDQSAKSARVAPQQEPPYLDLSTPEALQIPGGLPSRREQAPIVQAGVGSWLRRAWDNWLYPGGREHYGVCSETGAPYYSYTDETGNKCRIYL